MSEPTEAEVAAFDDAVSSDLGSRVATQKVREGDLDKAMQQAHVTQLEQANDLRRRFFTWVAWLVSTCVVAGIGVIAFYTWSQWGELDSTVILGWFSAEVVQTLGLAYIVAKYLFPSPHAPDPAAA